MIGTSAVVSGQRFMADQRRAEAPNRCLAVCEVEVDDPSEVFPSIDAEGAERNNSDALHQETLGVWVWTPIGPNHGEDATA